MEERGSVHGGVDLTQTLATRLELCKEDPARYGEGAKWGTGDL